MIRAEELRLKVKRHPTIEINRILKCIEACLEKSAEEGYDSCVFSSCDMGKMDLKEYAHRAGMQERSFHKAIFRDLWDNLRAVVFYLKKFGYIVHLNYEAENMENLTKSHGEVFRMVVSCG